MTRFLRLTCLLPAALEERAVGVLWRLGTAGVETLSEAGGRLRCQEERQAGEWVAFRLGLG